MRIAIDARLNAYRQGGIPQYTRQLLTALSNLVRDEHQLISLQHRDHLRPLAVAPNVARRTVLTPPHHRFEQWTLPLELLLARPDVLHCPDFIAPLHRPSPAVVTIHDLAFMHYPEILDDSARAYYGQIRTNAARADGIIAVSEATRQDIAQFLDIPIEEIAMIHEAAAPLYGRLELRPGEARVLGSTPVASDTFMLFVSTLEPRKNLPTLLHALRICLDRRPDRLYRLIAVGARGWRDETIFATVRDLRLGDNVLFTGSIGQYDLRWLYNACRLYINPSLYEGFGLPLLEAMACGAACLAAATSSLPEIGGNAALYIPPLDAGLWADAIEALWDDQERREELGRLGYVQSQRFSWMRAARETLSVYQRAVERAHPAATPKPAHAYANAPAEATAMPSAAGVEGVGRSCLRCGSAMLSRQLQRSILIAQPDSADDDRRLMTQTWLCPRCGHVELVAESAAALADVVPAEHDQADTLAVAVAVNDAAVSEVAVSEATISVGETDEHEPEHTGDTPETDEHEPAPVSDVPNWEGIPVAIGETDEHTEHTSDVPETDEHEPAPVSDVPELDEYTEHTSDTPEYTGDTPETDEHEPAPVSDVPELDEVIVAAHGPDAHDTAPAESLAAETQTISEAVVDAQAADDPHATIVMSRSSGEAYESPVPNYAQNGPNSTPHEATTPRASTTLVSERPIDTAQPDLATPQSTPTHPSDAPAAPAPTAPRRPEQAVRNGKDSNHLPSPADQSATTLPKKARQPRAKRKRSS